MQSGVTAAERPRRGVSPIQARTVVVSITGRKAIRSAVIWGSVFGLYASVSALGYATTYTTAESRAALVRSLGNNLGLNALIGPAHDIGTVTGFTAWRTVGVLSIVGGVWGLLAASRLLRGEEDAGRWELLLAGQTTRREATGQAIAGLLCGLLVLWAVSAAAVIVTGRANRVHIGPGSAMFLALAISAGAAVFLCVGALTCQLASTRRRAAGYAAIALGLSYGIRMVADSGTGLSWMRWLSPLGWVEELRPLTDPRPWLLIPIVGLMAVTGGLAVSMAGRRDLGAAALADRPERAPRTGLLGGPLRLAARLNAGVLSAWAISTAISGLLMGLIAKSVGTAIASTTNGHDAFAKLGFRGTGAEQYLGITFVLIAVLVALMTIGQVSAIRDEEATGRLDNLLVRPVSRTDWLSGRIAVTIAAGIGTAALAGLACWAGAASQGTGIGLSALLAAAVNVIPVAVVILGAGILAFGIRPRTVTLVTYGLLTWAVIVEILGSVINASHWVLDTSLLHQMSQAPAVDPDWSTNAVMTAVAVACGFAGVVLFRRRDLTGD